ncbi:MAG: CNNM domain-containing protein [Alistipes indistinctus]
MLLCCSALVSASETAFFSLSPHQAEGLRNRPSRSNSAALRLLDKSDYLLSTILIANNLVNICIVILSNALINSWIDFGGATGLEFAVKMVVVAFLLLFGEIMPKIFATYNSLRVIGLMAVPLRFLCALFRPVSYLLIRSGSLINRRMAQKKVNISMDELSNAIEMTSDQTVEEKKILSGIVEFVNTEVGEIMRSRVEVVALDETEDFARVKEVIMQSGYSRIPVYEENLDNVRGILYVKDVLPYISAADDFGWTNLCRKPISCRNTRRSTACSEEFQTQKIHIAIVVDEYGSTLGLISLEDILEEIVGRSPTSRISVSSLYEGCPQYLYFRRQDAPERPVESVGTG